MNNRNKTKSLNRFYCILGMLRMVLWNNQMSTITFYTENRKYLILLLKTISITENRLTYGDIS